ncbi:hypothetical protein LguiB_031467 [Lonicera macranthoides]
MMESLCWEHLLLLPDLKSHLIWFLRKSLSFLMIGKMGASTSADTQPIIPMDILYYFGESDESDQVSSEDDEEITLDPPHGNGKVEPKVEKAKPAKLVAAPAKPEPSTKSKAAPAPKKEEDDSDDEEDSDEDDSDDSAEFGSDVDMSEDDDSDDDDEDEETPKKPVSAKKRPSESASKTPVQAKKAKVETPQKTDGKKSGGHVATPHPAKKAEKTPASKNKGKEQSPKSGANIKCGSCSKTFNSDGALQSHSKAKHSAAK